MPYWFLKMVWNMMKWYYKSATVEEYNIWYVVANKAELLKAVWLTASMLMSSLVHKMPFWRRPRQRLYQRSGLYFFGLCWMNLLKSADDPLDHPGGSGDAAHFHHTPLEEAPGLSGWRLRHCSNGNIGPCHRSALALLVYINGVPTGMMIEYCLMLMEMCPEALEVWK